jgi:hypothetical protein
VFHFASFYKLFHLRVNKRRKKGNGLSPTGRARDGRALRGRHLQRLHHRRVEKLHEGQIGRAKAPPSSTRTGAPMAGETTNNFDHCFIDRNSSASITEKNNGLFQINKSPSLMDVSTELGAGSTRCWARPDLLLTLLIF